MTSDLAKCINCARCVRACDDVQCNEVIGRTGKGTATRIAFDLDQDSGAADPALAIRGHLLELEHSADWT